MTKEELKRLYRQWQDQFQVVYEETPLDEHIQDKMIDISFHKFQAALYQYCELELAKTGE